MSQEMKPELPPNDYSWLAMEEIRADYRGVWPVVAGCIFLSLVLAVFVVMVG